MILFFLMLIGGKLFFQNSSSQALQTLFFSLGLFKPLSLQSSPIFVDILLSYRIGLDFII